MRNLFGTTASLRWLGFVILLAGCASTPDEAIQAPRLTESDIEVMRVTIASVIHRMGPVAESPIYLKTATLTLGHPQDWDLIRTQLSPDERVAWPARNGSSFEIPELGISGLVNRREGDRFEGGPTVSVSAPIYPTRNSAVIYAGFFCGALCGQGFLIRLRRDGLSWRVTASQVLWIT